ncbi:unnamed protein product, partial [Pelagomonas calceolata]
HIQVTSTLLLRVVGRRLLDGLVEVRERVDIALRGAQAPPERRLGPRVQAADVRPDLVGDLVRAPAVLIRRRRRGARRVPGRRRPAARPLHLHPAPAGRRDVDAGFEVIPWRITRLAPPSSPLLPLLPLPALLRRSLERRDARQRRARRRRVPGLALPHVVGARPVQMLEAVPVERDASSFHVVHAPAPAPHHDDDAHEEDQGRGEAVEEVEVGLARASSGHFASLCVGCPWPSFRRLTRSVRACLFVLCFSLFALCAGCPSFVGSVTSGL